MPYTLGLTPDERLLTDIFFQPSQKTPLFRFAVTDQALYIPATKFVVSGDPTYFQRVPVAEVNEVRIEAEKPYGAYIGAFLMVAAGLAILYFIAAGEPFAPRTLGWGLAIVVGGILLPMAARGRHRLVIRFGGRCFRWSPPMVVDPGSKRQVAETLDKIVTAASRLGIPIADPRSAT